MDRIWLLLQHGLDHPTDLALVGVVIGFIWITGCLVRDEVLPRISARQRRRYLARLERDYNPRVVAFKQFTGKDAA